MTTRLSGLAICKTLFSLACLQCLCSFESNGLLACIRLKKYSIAPHGSILFCLAAKPHGNLWYVCSYDCYFSSTCSPNLGSFVPNGHLLATNPPHGNISFGLVAAPHGNILLDLAAVPHGDIISPCLMAIINFSLPHVGSSHLTAIFDLVSLPHGDPPHAMLYSSGL